MKVKALTKMFAAMATLVLLTGTITPAGAAMQAVSPGTNPFGFPLWYQDTSGQALELCLDNNPFCNLLPDAAFIPANPLLLPGNFPVESFYMIADSILPTTGGKNSDAKLRLALEATFATGTATLGQQITFLLVNLQKMDNLPPSTTCTVTHPYGTFTFTTDSLGTTLPGLGGQGFRARDPITPVPGVFSGIVGPGTTPNANIGPFLRSSTGFVTDPISGNVYISSAFAALTTVTGSPAGNNFFSIDCPNIGGPGINHVQTNLFNLSGKVVGLLLTPPAVTDFGVFKLGSPSPVKTFTVQNLTGAALIPTLTSSNPVFSITPGTCGAPVVANGTCTFDVTFTPAANGAQSSTITVSSSGLPSATSIVNGTGDGVAPTLTFDPVISFTKLSTQTISGTVTDNNGVGSVQVTVNGVAQTPITAPAGTTSFIWTKLITLPTANGINSISVTASDTAQPGGNLSATQTATITNDTINPVVSITTPAAGLSNNRNPNLSFIASDTNLAFTTVTVDNVGVTPVPATLGPLADGLHTVRVDAGDSAGNSGTATSSFEVDATPPVITVTSPTAGNIGKTSPVLTFTVTDAHPDGAQTVVKVDGVVVAKVSGDTLGPFTAGPHTLTIDAKDILANASPTTTVPFTVVLTDGDINMDGTIDITDALNTLRVAVGLDTTITPGSDKFLHADVAPLVNNVPTPNNVIDMDDASTILRKVVGLATF